MWRPGLSMNDGQLALVIEISRDSRAHHRLIVCDKGVDQPQEDLWVLRRRAARLGSVGAVIATGAYDLVRIGDRRYRERDLNPRPWESYTTEGMGVSLCNPIRPATDGPQIRSDAAAERDLAIAGADAVAGRRVIVAAYRRYQERTACGARLTALRPGAALSRLAGWRRSRPSGGAHQASVANDSSRRRASGTPRRTKVASSWSTSILSP
jgi:hypothetical protein